MKGKRVYPDANGNMLFAPGDYGFENGEWSARPPDTVSLGSLRSHEVVEHKDGTITVNPSILITQGDGASWHGHLKKGVWTKC